MQNISFTIQIWMPVIFLIKLSKSNFEQICVYVSFTLVLFLLLCLKRNDFS